MTTLTTQTTSQLAFQNMLSTFKPVIRKIHLTFFSKWEVIRAYYSWIYHLRHRNLFFDLSVNENLSRDFVWKRRLFKLWNVNITRALRWNKNWEGILLVWKHTKNMLQLTIIDHENKSFFDWTFVKVYCATRIAVVCNAYCCSIKMSFLPVLKS